MFDTRFKRMVNINVSIFTTYFINKYLNDGKSDIYSKNKCIKKKKGTNYEQSNI